VPWPGSAPGGFFPQIAFDRVLDRVRYVELMDTITSAR